MPKKPKTDIEDEPGAEDRFKRGITNALNTPPKPFTPKKARAKTASTASGKSQKSTGK